MEGARWKQIEDVFARALEVEGDRSAFVATACGDDLELRAEVLSLLESSEGAASSVRAAIASVAHQVAGATARSRSGQRMGPYRLGDVLGEGGMGVVYAAERDDTQYRRSVAVKILPHGLGSPQAIARFRDERQILAALDHPGIVRLLDGGTTDDGLPYLVMEMVDGVPLSTYVKTRPIRARVELVRAVCAALQYAHGKLVVHRDIKPSNILIDADGTPKLLDFGIAKLIDPDATDKREARTRTGVALLTPEYASPEQARGEPVSVATDVYSLGAVLYEALAGQPPQRPEGGPLEVLRMICEVDPPRPSTVASAEYRREIAGDLDNIVMKALNKEQGRRYASVEQLADDLECYLGGLPVGARTATIGYRAGKFVRRHRGKLALASLVAIALSSATVISIRQAQRADAEARRANKRFEDVRKLANSLLFEIDESIRGVAGTTRARELVVSRALTYLDSLATEAADDPTLARELAIAYMRIGDIQGSPYDPNIGKTADGLESYQKANALLTRLDPKDAAVTEARIRAAFGIAFMLHSNRDVPRARASLVAALELAHGAQTTVHIDPIMLARGYDAIAFLEKEANNPVESQRYTDEGLALVETWPREAPDTRYWRATFLALRADAAARVGDPDRAAASLQEIVGLHAALEREYPQVAKYRRERGYALLQLGVVTSGVGDARLWVANTGELQRAESAFREGIAIYEQAAIDDPVDADLKMVVAALRTSLGLAIAKRSAAEAVATLEQAVADFQALPTPMRESVYGREGEFIAHCALAPTRAAVGRRADAEASAQRGLALAEGNPFLVAICKSLVAEMFQTLGHTDAAASQLDAVVQTLGPLADRADTAAAIGLVDALSRLADVRPMDACRLHREALERWRARPRDTRYLRQREAELEQALPQCPDG